MALMASVVELCADVLGKRIALDDDLISCGADSLKIAQLVLFIEDKFGVQLEPLDIVDAGTPHELARTIFRDHPDRTTLAASMSDDERRDLSANGAQGAP